MPYRHSFEVSNPSGYPRSDYVEVSLQQLGVPLGTPDGVLRLIRGADSGSADLPCQIDHPFGSDRTDGVLSFRTEHTPPAGVDDYSSGSDLFTLEERADGREVSPPPHSKLRLEYFHVGADGSHEMDPAPEWDRSRDVHGLKLHTACISVYMSLVPHPGMRTTVNYAGSATSIYHAGLFAHTQDGDMLKPFWSAVNEQARWGQLTQLVFYPLPWDQRWYSTHSLIEPIAGPGTPSRRYRLVQAHVGPVRGLFTWQSDPFRVTYEGTRYQPRIDLNCALYRTISFYPDADSYVEDLTVRSDDGLSIAFRPHFYSFTDFPAQVGPQLSRIESIPDCFAVWRSFARAHRGFGFAADSHVREPELRGNDLRWRLQLTHSPRCLHQFMYHFPEQQDPFDRIGRSWYERILKPLHALPLPHPWQRWSIHATSAVRRPEDSPIQEG